MLIVILIVVLVTIFVFFQVMVAIGVAGKNPSKLLSSLIKKKSDEVEPCDNIGDDNVIKRWRLIAGILFASVMFCLLAFFRPSLVGGIFPVIYYLFWPLVFATIIIFIILAQKEKTYREKQKGVEIENKSVAAKIKMVVHCLIGGLLLCVGILVLYTYFSIAMSSSRNLYGIGLAFLLIVVGVRIIYFANSMVENIVAYIVGWIFVCIGLLGSFAEFGQAMTSSASTGLLGIWIAALFLSSGLYLFYLAHRKLDHVITRIASWFCLFFGLGILFALVSDSRKMDIFDYSFVALFFVCSIIFFFLVRFRYGGGIWTIIGILFLVLGNTRIVNTIGLYMGKGYLKSSILWYFLILAELVAGGACLIVGYLRYQKRKLLLNNVNMQP
jgi:hypothetical protein